MFTKISESRMNIYNLIFSGFFLTTPETLEGADLPKKSVFVSHLRFENEEVFDCLTKDGGSLKYRFNPHTRYTFYEGKNFLLAILYLFDLIASRLHSI